jgi:hypothetical protein
MKLGFNALWSTTVYHGKIDNHDLLESVIKDILVNFPISGTQKSLGENNILLEGIESLKIFEKEVIYNTFEQYLNQVYNLSISDYTGHKFQAWLAGFGMGYQVSNHNHYGSQISGVFYILSEESDRGGSIVFTDPRTNANRGYDKNFQKNFSSESFQPSTGDFLIFPSYLYHHVNSYYSSLRIAMPVDLFLFDED